jgi:putative tryptophan/tyrosine transport system substrate-binding protein
VDVRRREFITLLGGSAAGSALSRFAHAQPGERMRRIGVLMLGDESDSDQQDRVRAFRSELAKMGWAEGRNIRIDYRFAATDAGRIISTSADFIAQKLDVILANGTPVLEALQKQTRTVPIVFVGVSDPLSAGFIPSMARPGGNITGFSNFEYAISGKWLELLHEIAPSIKRVAVLQHRDDAAWPRYLAPIETLAPSLGIQSSNAFLGEPAEIEHIFDMFARERNGGVIVTNNARAMAQRQLISTLAARYHLPAVYPARIYAASGGLISYGIDPVDPYRRAAGYIDRILKGEKPGDLPVQAPTKYELAVNLKTAKALGIHMPPTLLARADEVIE